MHTNNEGYVLLTTIFCISIFIFLIASIAKITICLSNTYREKLCQVKVFYLSEAGLETAKSKVAAEALWFTDYPHAENDKKWLIYSAIGKTYFFGEGGFKIVKEQGKYTIYSVAFLGNDLIKSNYINVQKISYDLPMKQKMWEVL